MAHECPECGYSCHCGGDIEDLEMDNTPEQMACTHCLDDAQEEYRDDFED